MKLVGLEEHFATPEVVAAWLRPDPSRQDLTVPRYTGNDKEKMLLDLAEARIAAKRPRHSSTVFAQLSPRRPLLRPPRHHERTSCRTYC